MPKIVCIDGNIGAGKSTTLQQLSKLGYRVFTEELNSWEWVLNRYYEDSRRWGFTLQLAILHSMQQQKCTMNALSDSIVFIERSPASGLVFAKSCLNQKFLTLEEYNLIERYYNLIGWQPSVTYLIDTPAAVCLERIKTRNRICEQEVKLHYLLTVESFYREQIMPTATVVDGSSNAADMAQMVLMNLTT